MSRWDDIKGLRSFGAWRAYVAEQDFTEGGPTENTTYYCHLHKQFPVTTMASEGFQTTWQSLFDNVCWYSRGHGDTAKIPWVHLPNSPQNGYTEKLTNVHPKGPKSQNKSLRQLWVVLSLVAACALFKSMVLEKNMCVMIYRGLTKGWFSKRVVLADVPQERKPEWGYIRMFPRNENRNEGTFACSLWTKTGTRVRSPKPPFYEAALLSPSEFTLLSHALQNDHLVLKIQARSDDDLRPDDHPRSSFKEDQVLQESEFWWVL